VAHLPNENKDDVFGISYLELWGADIKRATMSTTPKDGGTSEK